jgi:phosphate starvation-inducible protein PhoH and related proteins
MLQFVQNCIVAAMLMKFLKAKKLINFMTTSFIRGITISDTILVVDEAQNLTDAELHSIITRVGKNTKVIFSGDFGQNDLIYKRMEQSGIVGFMKILAKMPSFRTIEFDIDDIVRSGLVKEYIIARHNLGM